MRSASITHCTSCICVAPSAFPYATAIVPITAINAVRSLMEDSFILEAPLMSRELSVESTTFLLSALNSLLSTLDSFCPPPATVGKAEQDPAIAEGDHGDGAVRGGGELFPVSWFGKFLLGLGSVNPG